MRSGTVVLESGRWHWTLLPQWTGATVVYQHRERVHDEMRSWTPEAELSADEALELAMDAFERIWIDVDGLKWRLSLELPTRWNRQEDSPDDPPRDISLLFKRGGIRKTVFVPGDTKLGQLSHSDLMAHLEEAYAAPGDLA